MWSRQVGVWARDCSIALRSEIGSPKLAVQACGHSSWWPFQAQLSGLLSSGDLGGCKVPGFQEVSILDHSSVQEVSLSLFACPADQARQAHPSDTQQATALKGEGHHP